MKKFVSVILAALMMSGLVSCISADKNTPSDSTTVSVQGNVSDAAEKLTVVSEGVTEYKIIRSDTATETIKNAAIKLRDAFQTVCGTTPKLESDFEKRGTDVSERYKYEILVGNTNREESEAALGAISYNEFTVRTDGTRIVIMGGSDAATVKAVDWFIENCLTEKNMVLEGGVIYASPKGELGYGKESLSIDGVDISDYTIVYNSTSKNAAKALAGRLGELCGAKMKTMTDSNAASGHEIVIGSSKRGTDASGYGADDFAVYEKEGSYYIAGGSDYAVETCCKYFCDKLAAKGVALTKNDVTLEYRLPDRQTYINDISKLALHWELYFDVPEWMLDFSEKYSQMKNPTGRLMSCIHRGDSDYYPENSIEGIISAVRMGGDMIEIDPRLTKDGVLVLLHDNTLTRTTDYSAKSGKNGLPTSPYVYDWTYEQLQELNLKSGNGGDSAKVTVYRIPTLDEAFHVSAGRLFIRLDVKTKTNTSGEPIVWNYAKDIWTLQEKYRSYDNVIFTWHSVFYSDNYSLVKTYKAKAIAAGGRGGICFVGCNSSKTANAVLSTISANRLDSCVRLTDFDSGSTDYTQYIKDNASKLASFRGKTRLYIDAPKSHEEPTAWDALNEAGINVLLVNHGYSLCRHIAETYG